MDLVIIYVYAKSRLRGSANLRPVFETPAAKGH
jgi:hypothetical protein